MKINTTYFKLKERHIYGSSRVGVRNSDLDILPLPDKNFSMTTVHYSIGSRTYELSNHLGNVLSVISDKVIPVFSSSTVISEMRADIRVAQDYSPFGVTLDGRDFVVSEGYRYGFQNQEVDDEVKSEGNSVNYKYRMHDPRIGRFFAVDSLTSVYSYNSPYAFSENRVIDAVELEGLEIMRITDLKNGRMSLNFFGPSDALILYDEYGLLVDQSMGINFKYKTLQYQMEGFDYDQKSGMLTTPHKGEDYLNPGPCKDSPSDMMKCKQEFSDPQSTFNISFEDISKSKFKHVRSTDPAKPSDITDFSTPVDKVVSKSFTAPESSITVNVEITVDYALQKTSDGGAAARGMIVTITKTGGEIVATGVGGETFNFDLSSGETFTVSVSYTGSAETTVQTYMTGTMVPTELEIDN